MKENWISWPQVRPKYVERCFLIMRLTMYLLLIGTLHLAANTYSQNSCVSLNMQQVSLREVVEKLQKVTDYTFLYKNELLNTGDRLDVNVKDRELREVLDEILSPRGLAFEIDDKVIVIRRQNSAQQQAEEIRIQGKVVDEQHISLPGVTVLVKGTGLGVTTDAEGKFRFRLPKSSQEVVLVFSFVGMEKKEVSWKGEAELQIVMRPDVAEMDEVVVTGIFKKARESYTGSVSTITREELKMHRGQNLLQTLKNADASLNFAVNNVAGSNPNVRPRVNIRGNSSLPSLDALNNEVANTVNEPLVIMDGFEITLDRLMDYNDEEIESINILKDAAATAIYGSKGANGVIVITTREPEAGKLRLNVSAGIDMEIPDLTSYDLLNAQEKLALEKELDLYNALGEYMAYQELYNKRYRNVLAGASTDWINKPIRTGVSSHYNLRLEGGSDQFRWSVTTNYRNVAGAMKNSYRRSFNGSINLMYTVKNFTFKNYTSYGLQRGRESNYGSFSDYVAQQPWQSPYDEKGNVLEYLESFSGSTKEDGVRNPLYDASLNVIDKSGSETLTNNFAIDWNIMESMTLRGQFGISTTTNHSDNFLPANHSYFTVDNAEEYSTDEGFFRRGRYTYGNSKSNSYNGNLTLSYSKSFADKHQLYVGLDYSLNMSDNTSYTFVVEGFSNENMDFLGNAGGYEKDGIPAGSESKSRSLGFTGNVNYTYDNRYYVDFSARMDGSSEFGSDNKFAPFWSVGVGWNLHNEKFFKGGLFNTLRLKASYGSTGSQASGGGASTLYAYQTGNRYLNWIGSSLQSWGNPDLTWQSTNQFNAGTEVGLCNGRVRAEFEFYTKTTTNLLSSMDLPHSMGLSSYQANVGEVKNLGWETSLNTYVVRDTERDLYVMLNGQLVYDKSWVSKLSETIKERNEIYLQQDVDVSNLLYEGKPQNAIYAIRSLGIDPATGQELFLNRKGEVTDTWKASDKVYCGQSDPRYRGNLNATLMWKGLTFNMGFYFYWGGKVYNQTLIDRVEVTTNSLKTSNVDRRVYTERWMKPGDVAFFKGFSNNATRASSRFVMPDKVFEMASVSLQYRWDTDWVRKTLGTQSVNFSVNMNDLFHWGSVKQERGTSYPFARNIQGTVSFLF